MNPKE